jgi:hypothetical protein
MIQSVWFYVALSRIKIVIKIVKVNGVKRSDETEYIFKNGKGVA